MWTATSILSANQSLTVNLRDPVDLALPGILLGHASMTGLSHRWVIKSFLPFGFILLGMASLAIGQLFSALTENQIVAALLTVSVLLGTQRKTAASK